MEDFEVEIVGGPRERIVERLERFDQWRRNLVVELVALPETLATFRRGANNFEVVSQRLAESSDALEHVTSVYEATVADSARRSADLAKALRSQVDTLAAAGSPDRARGAVREMQRLVGTFQQLNPLWPGSPPPTVSEGPDDADDAEEPTGDDAD